MRSRHITLMAAEAAAPLRRPRLMELLTLLALLVAAGWIAYAFAEQAYLDSRLAQEETGLRQQNAQLQLQNAQYQKDVGAVLSGADAEESARHEGYARPNEKVYVVSGQDGAAPPARAVVRVNDGQGDLAGAAARWLGDRLHGR